MWELDHEESWTMKNWCARTVVLKTLESPLECKEIQPVNSKGNQSWIFIGRTIAEAEAPILWPLDAKSQLIEKDPDVGKDWGQEEKGMTEDKMVGWHCQVNGVWASSRRWWRTGKPGVLQSMGLQRVEHDWATELNWTLKELTLLHCFLKKNVFPFAQILVYLPTRLQVSSQNFCDLKIYS